MWYKWLIFAVIFLAVPFGVASLKVWSKKQLSFVPTAEQEKAADLKFGLLMFFYWLCDLFYMSFIIDSLVLRFIFGGIIMLVIFFNLSKAFINAATPQPKWGLVQDFIVGVGMSIYLIYIIPDPDLQNVVIPIVSAVYGGLITLVGVAWTIRHGQEERKKDEIQKAKPLFTFNMMYAPLATVEGKKVCFDEDENNKKRNCQVVFEIENSNQSSFVIERLFHDGQWWNLDANKVVLPNKTIYIEFHFTEDVNNLFVEVKDALGNCYYYEIKVLCLNLLTRPTPHHPFLHTVREIREISLTEIENRIK